MAKIFVDCGASDGRASEIFLNNRHEDWIFYLFEPNDIYWSPLLGFQKKRENVKIEIYKSAVWIDSYPKKFNLFSNHESCHSMWHKLDDDFIGTTLVECIDLDKWTKKHIKRDYAILKMDIEGAEFAILPKMIRSGSLLRYKELWIEFHERFDTKYKKPHKEILEYLLKHPEIKVLLQKHR